MLLEMAFDCSQPSLLGHIVEHEFPVIFLPGHILMTASLPQNLHLLLACMRQRVDLRTNGVQNRDLLVVKKLFLPRPYRLRLYRQPYCAGDGAGIQFCKKNSR